MLINNNFINSNISVLFEGSKVLNLLTEDQYKKISEPVFPATIGAHFRHILEHYQCFFKQLEDKHFCYDLRQRNSQLETDLQYAKKILLDLTTTMHELDDDAFNGSYTISDESVAGDIDTSLARELVFLQSHTTHHYAIIAAIARSLKIQPDTDFGIAIATRSHQMMLQNTENTPCVR